MSFSVGFMSGVGFTLLLSWIDRMLYVRRMRRRFDEATIKILEDSK